MNSISIVIILHKNIVGEFRLKKKTYKIGLHLFVLKLLSLLKIFTSVSLSIIHIAYSFGTINMIINKCIENVN